MTRLFFARPEQRELLRAVGIPIFAPATDETSTLDASAQVSMRTGVTTLDAITLQYRASPPSQVLVQTFVREQLLSSIPSSERGPSLDAHIVSDYLEREGRSELAMRSLEVPEGVGHTLPLSRMLAERQAELAATVASIVLIDANPVPAHSVTYNRHSVTWCDLPDLAAALEIYTNDGPASLELVTVRA